MQQASPTGEPLRVAVAGAGGQISYSLLPMIARGEMFGPTRRVVLQCLDLNSPAVKENMRGVGMELQDGNLPLLQRVVFCTDEAVAFMDADYAILLGAYPKGKRERREVMDKNIMIFRTMGHAIEKHSKSDCRVVVVGQPANTNAHICAEFAPSRPKENFFALSRLDHNRALGKVATWAGKDGKDVSVGDIRNVIIWGNVAGTMVPDVDHCTVKGKPLMQRYLKDDVEMLKSSIAEDVRQRGAAIFEARKASGAMSAARAIVNHVHSLHCGTEANEFVSMGVWSDGSAYGVGKDLFYSQPVSCQGRGRFRIAPNLQVSDGIKAQMQNAQKELANERDFALQMIKTQDTAQRSKRPPATQPS